MASYYEERLAQARKQGFTSVTQMLLDQHRAADPAMLIGKYVVDFDQVRRVLVLLRDNPSLTATELLAIAVKDALKMISPEGE